MAASAPDASTERACANIRNELVECLVSTESFRLGKSLQEVLRDHDASPQCQQFRQAYYQCRKAQVRTVLNVSVLHRPGQMNHALCFCPPRSRLMPEIASGAPRPGDVGTGPGGVFMMDATHTVLQ